MKKPLSIPLDALGAPVLAVAATAVLLVVPTGERETETVDGTGTTRSSGPVTLLQAEGLVPLMVMAGFVVLTVLPLLAAAPTTRRHLGIVCAALLAIGVLGTLPSVGLCYLPALIAMAITVARSRGNTAPTRSRVPGPQ